MNEQAISALRAIFGERESDPIEMGSGDSSSEAPADEQEEKAPGMAPTGSRGGPRSTDRMSGRERAATKGDLP